MRESIESREGEAFAMSMIRRRKGINDMLAMIALKRKGKYLEDFRLNVLVDLFLVVTTCLEARIEDVIWATKDYNKLKPTLWEPKSTAVRTHISIESRTITSRDMDERSSTFQNRKRERADQSHE